MSWYDANLKSAICYSRYKFKMLSDLQELYRKYLAGELGAGQQPPQESVPPCESTFCDNFESNWHSLNTYVSQFGETFEQQWFISNTFVNEYEDEFERGWFIFNNYIPQGIEDFESGDWDE